MSNQENKEKSTRNPLGGPPSFVLTDDENEAYVVDRLAPCIRWFERVRDRDRIFERVIQYLIIVFSALIPVINVIGPVSSSQEGSVTSTTSTQVPSAIFGALIVMLVGILQFEKFHDKWLLFKRTAVDLRREYYNWKNCIGDYKSEKGNLALLIERCETILKDETGEYLRYFSNSSTSTNQGREEGSKT